MERKLLELQSYKINEAVEHIMKTNSRKDMQLASAILSTAVSLCVSYNNYDSVGSVIEQYGIISIFLIYILGFSFCYNSFLLIARIVEWCRNLLRYYNTDKSSTSINHNIEKFDLYICNNVLLARDYEIIFCLETDKNIKEYYFFKIVNLIYCSIECLELILLTSEKHLTNFNRTTGIDLYRIDNIFNIIDNVVLFINDNKNVIKIEEKLEKLLNTNIDNINTKKNNLKGLLENLKDDL